MKTIIHVNQHVIKANRKYKTNNPVITVKQGRSNQYGHKVEITGPSRIVYSPHKPLHCGATVWLETNSLVLIDFTK